MLGSIVSHLASPITGVWSLQKKKKNGGIQKNLTRIWKVLKMTRNMHKWHKKEAKLNFFWGEKKEKKFSAKTIWFFPKNKSCSKLHELRKTHIWGWGEGPGTDRELDRPPPRPRGVRPRVAPWSSKARLKTNFCPILVASFYDQTSE